MGQAERYPPERLEAARARAIEVGDLPSHHQGDPRRRHRDRGETEPGLPNGPAHLHAAQSPLRPRRGGAVSPGWAGLADNQGPERPEEADRARR